MLVAALTTGTVLFASTIPLALTGWQARSAELASEAWNDRRRG